MTPIRLTSLVVRALSRTPTRLELDVWGEALACRGQAPCPTADCVHDDEADQALRQHVAQSTFPPTPADVRRIAIGLANLRIEEAQRLEREASFEHAVPPTPEYLEARRKFDAAQAARARELEEIADSSAAEQAERDRVAAAVDELQRTEEALVEGSPS